MNDAGLPPGVFNLVHGYGNEVGEAIINHSSIKAISFTGGTSTGRRVGEVTGRLLKKCSLELGGKNPAIIFSDCDLENVVNQVVRSSFLNSGQICLCSSRLIVQDSIYDEFLEKLKEKASNLKIGYPQEEVDLGPVISLDHKKSILSKMNEALKDENTNLVWEHPDSNDDLFNDPKTAFVRPAILECSDQTLPINQQETFGPVITLSKFSTISEAISKANQTNYGLASTLYSNDLSTIMYVSDQLESGLVWVNTWLLRDLRTPFGGVKESGVGREGGEYSLNFFSSPKTTTIGLNFKGMSSFSKMEGSNKSPISPAPPMPSNMPSSNNNNNNNNQPQKRSFSTSTTSSDKENEEGEERIVRTSGAPKPVGEKFLKASRSLKGYFDLCCCSYFILGSYPHARIVQNDSPLLFVSGIGARNPIDNTIPGGPVRDENKIPNPNYNIELQTHQCIQNIKVILEDVGLSLDDVIICNIRILF